MKKVDFIRAIAERGEFTKADVRRVLDVLQEIVYEGLKADEEIPIIDGVKLSRRFKPSYEAKNPMTGVKCVVPDKYHPRCRFGTKIKEAIN